MLLANIFFRVPFILTCLFSYCDASEAEKLGFKSLYLLESRIQECLESKDKERLLDYLSQLNEYFAGQPHGALDPQVREIWRSRLADLDK